MPQYPHKCPDHGPFDMYVDSWAEYEKLTEVYGRGDDENLTIPCPDCSGVSPRNYADQAPPGAIVKGGYKHQYSQNYRAGAEEEWIRNEVGVTKKVLNKDVGAKHRPYAAMTLPDPEKVGFKKVSPQEGAKRAEVAKKTQGDAVARVTKGRKKKTNG
jgi:hypothetical protein